jgi:hypothetical protein
VPFVSRLHNSLFGGGGSRSADPFPESATYRFYVARNTHRATDTVDHCTLLHAGFRPERTATVDVYRVK